MPIGTAQARMTQLRPFVNGRQRQQALRQLARTWLQIHVQSAGRRESTPANAVPGRPGIRANPRPGPLVNRMQRW